MHVHMCINLQLITPSALGTHPPYSKCQAAIVTPHGGSKEKHWSLTCHQRLTPPENFNVKPEKAPLEKRQKTSSNHPFVC